MPLPADVDTSSPRHLSDNYAIVGVGEITYTCGSRMTTRSLGTCAVRNAILDAGLKPADVHAWLASWDYTSLAARWASLVADHFPASLTLLRPSAAPNSRAAR